MQLTPQSVLPSGCGGELVAPAELDDRAASGNARWRFSTYGDLRLGTLSCSGYGRNEYCPSGPLKVTFSNPVRGAEVLRRIRLFPETKFTIRDTSAESTEWTLEAPVKPRVGYALVADTALRDVFGQSLKGNPALGYRTTGFAPTIIHAYGRLLVERAGFRTLAVQHVNVDTLVAVVAPIPDSLEARLLTGVPRANDSIWTTLLRNATVQRMPVRRGEDRPMITGVKLPVADASRPGTPSLFAVRMSGVTLGSAEVSQGPPTLVQVTDLAVHAKIGVTEGVVWITGVSDGKPRPGAAVELHDAVGRRIATGTTDAQGIVRFTSIVDSDAREVSTESDEEEGGGSFEGYVSATLGTDRALTAINRYDPDLSPWRFNVRSAYGDERLPLVGAVFTERGIYRPGEKLYAKAIVRNGALGALRAPPAGDSIKWIFHDREDGVLREITAALSPFGTSSQTLDIPASAAIGSYRVETQVKRLGKWRMVADDSYRVAEYRPPQFLVDLVSENATHLPGDMLATRAQARYLFGAPMGRAQISWEARQSPVSSWALQIPGTDGWYLGDSGAWWENDDEHNADVFASKTDTLDARGERGWTVKLPPTTKGRAARVTIEATVTDINRQVVGTRTTSLVHPAEFYVAAKPAGEEYFWKAGTPQTVNLMAVRPTGEKVAGVRINGTLVRREWHQVRRERNGISELVGEWVSDTVGHCIATSAESAVPCAFSAVKAGGLYVVSFKASDRGGRVANTSFQRWASGEGWVPWNDETQFKMDVIPDRTRYSVGDTATVMFASPFTDAEAWITVEREGLIQQRRMRLTSGSTTLKFPITEAFAPNAFISIIVARGRSAPPGTLDDAGRPTMRVGYAELRVTPEIKRLAITVSPEKAEYRPGDSARVRVRVRDTQGRGPRSEVTLWAVDEGVLALTGYKTPDPIDLLYRERGLGMRLASNLTAVAPQIPEGEKGRREAGGGGGADGADILRSRFQTTAFFLGSVVTDAQGNAEAVAKLPDNITTFRIMAVAVTAGDRYGKGESSMLVTRPLLARQALPRFVRPGDIFNAGAVINRRDGTQATVKVNATATGVTLRGESEKTTTLAALRGTEVRFPFQATRVDSATFRFDVADDRDRDAVRVTIPMRPDHHPVTHTLAGVLHDSATVELALPAGIDVDRSRLTLNVGTSSLATIRGIAQQLHIYPYYCSEQVISTAVPLIALHHAQRESGEAMKPEQLADIKRGVEMLSSRQRTDGGIGYWSSTDWTSPWLSAYAGMVLLDARDEGVKVDTLVLSRLAAYVGRGLRGSAAGESNAEFTLVSSWNERPDMRLRDLVAAADFLSRMGRPAVAAENELLRTAALLTLEDRARLAEVLARRRQTAAARRLMEPTWAQVRVEGTRATLPDTGRERFYFESRMRPIARILTATLAVDPQHPLVGPLAETLAQQSRAGAASWMWNTQDYASAVTALATLDQRRREQGDRTVRVRAGGRLLLEGGSAAQKAARDSSVALKGLLASAGGQQVLRLSLDAGPGDGAIYYYLTVTEIPLAPPVVSQDHGIQVERWYERFDSRTVSTTIAEGDMVRVRLKITVPTLRYFVVLDDALPAGLEAVDLSLRTASAMPGPGTGASSERAEHEESDGGDTRTGWYGSWDSGWWSPFDHREMRDDRVVYSATLLWPGTYTASYLARATTPGTFIKPPAHAEEMYNPGVNGRSDGGTFVITPRK
ncbi:MAG: alpha-2-macroglobulin family protein [Gemmatimonadaceae bacterium]